MKRRAALFILPAAVILPILCSFIGALAGLAAEKQYLEDGWKMIEIGRYKEASSLFHTAILINLNNYEGYIGKGAAYELMKDTASAKKLYDKALELNPQAKIPDLKKYRERDANRGKDADKIREKYLASKGQAAPEPGPAAAPSTAPVSEVQYWHRGGRARAESLGGLKHASPDASAALDAYGFGIDAGLLFRTTAHVFNLSPAYAFDSETIKYSNGAEKKDEAMAMTAEGSEGEINWVSDNYGNKIYPSVTNTWRSLSNKEEGAGTDSGYKNAGSLFGVGYTALIRPNPLFGIAASVKYRHVPYVENRYTEGAPVNDLQNLHRKIAWQAGMGFRIPSLVVPDGALDFTAAIGSYEMVRSPVKLFEGSLKELPYSFSPTDTMELSEKTKSSHPLAAVTDLVTTKTYGASGLEAKGGLHYMAGDGLQEFFLFAAAPFNIAYDYASEYKMYVEGTSALVDSGATGRMETGKARGFCLSAGSRNSLVYVTPGIRYDYSYFEAHCLEGYAPFAQKEIEKSHSVTGSLNITPVREASVPFEVSVINGLHCEPGKSRTFSSVAYRGGLEVKPDPSFALRGGISWKTTKSELAYGGGETLKPDTPLNPIEYALGYHGGVGFFHQRFEINLGGVFLQAMRSPELEGITSAFNYGMAVMADVNIYM